MAKPCTKYLMNICKRLEKQEKRVQSEYSFGKAFSKSKGHYFVKNQWIKAKLELGLYLSMAKQYTKYQKNI